MDLRKSKGFILGLALLAIWGHHFHRALFSALGRVFSAILALLACSKPYVAARGPLTASERALYDARRHGRNQLQWAKTGQGLST